MEFSKHKAGILTALLCLGVIAAVIWFCLSGMTQKKIPDGVLVQRCISTGTDIGHSMHRNLHNTIPVEHQCQEVIL